MVELGLHPKRLGHIDEWSQRPRRRPAVALANQKPGTTRDTARELEPD